MFARTKTRGLTRRFTVGNGEVLVFDDLFAKRTQRLIYEHLRGAHFHWGALDSDAAAHAHAVRWRRNIDLAASRLPFFSDVAELVHKLAPGFVLDRVYANFNLYGEVHYPHVDAAHGATVLYCANLVWNADWQGETLFYERGEPMYAVLPRPGRLIVFDASLRHRGSPPARDCFEPRINVAFKFQRVRTSRIRAKRTRFVPIQRR